MSPCHFLGSHPFFVGKKYFNRVGWTGHKGMSDQVCSSPGLIHSKRCRTLSRNTDFSFLLQIMNMSQNRSPPDPRKRCLTLSGKEISVFSSEYFFCYSTKICQWNTYFSFLLWICRTKNLRLVHTRDAGELSWNLGLFKFNCLNWNIFMVSKSHQLHSWVPCVKLMLLFPWSTI